MERETWAPYKKLLLTSLSASIAETATFPIDLTKTRLQLHDSHSKSLHVALDVVRRQGARGLYRGLSPAVFRHVIYTPARIVGYEQLRSWGKREGEGEGELSLSTKAAFGGLSGVVAQIVGSEQLRNWRERGRGISFYLYQGCLRWSLRCRCSVQIIASPADLVKVRMQADGRMTSQGLQPRYSGPFNALNKIIQNEGYRGLWKGVIPNAQRAFLVNMGELACYDHAKRFVIQNKIANDNIFAHTLASVMSGLSATALSCPADVVKTRMMNQRLSGEGNVRYVNSYDCVVKTVKSEGVRALWKGFFPTWARLGPWQFIFWVSYEKLRKVAGFSSF